MAIFSENKEKGHWLIIFFLVFSFLAINLKNYWSFVFYLGITGIVLFSLFKNGPKGSIKKISLNSVVYFLIGILFYFFWSKKIADIEFWGDELGVIYVAKLPFEKIIPFISTNHASALPLDYWNMWIWKFAADLFPVSYREFAYRIPYMFFHLLAAIIFALTVEKESKNKGGGKIISLLAFLTYFFNPLLLLYSIEVRFYSQTALGATVSLYLFLRKKLFRTPYFIFMLYFCLNSVFQFIILLPLIAYEFIRKRSDKKEIVFCFFCLIMLFLTIKKIILIPQPVSHQESIKLIFSALNILINSQFWSLFLKVIFSFLIIVPLFRKHTRPKTLLFSGFISFYILVISLTAYIKGYFDFYVRHYLFVLPFFLFLFFVGFSKIKKQAVIFFFIFLYLNLSFIWIHRMTKILYTSDLNQNFYTKALLGNKAALELAKHRSFRIVIFPYVENSFPKENYRFNVWSIVTYAKFFYPAVKIKIPSEPAIACNYFFENEDILLISPGVKIECSQNIGGFKKRLFFSEILLR